MQIMAVPSASIMHVSLVARHWRLLISSKRLSTGQHGAPVPLHAAAAASLSVCGKRQHT